MEQSGDGPEDRNRPQRLEVSSKRELVPCRLESPRHGSTLPPEPTSRAARGSRYREQQPARSPRAPAQESRPAFPVEDVPSRQGNSRSGGIRASHGRDLNHRRSPLTRVLQRTCRNDFQLVNSPRAGPCRRAPAATSSNVGPPAPTAARFGRAGARAGLRTVTGNSIEHVGITVPSGRSRPSTWTPVAQLSTLDTSGLRHAAFGDGLVILSSVPSDGEGSSAVLSRDDLRELWTVTRLDPVLARSITRNPGAGARTHLGTPQP